MKSLLFSLSVLLSTQLLANESLFLGKNPDGKSIAVNYEKDSDRYVLQLESRNPVYFPAKDPQKIMDLFVAVRNSTAQDKAQHERLKFLGKHIMRRLSKEIPFPTNEEMLKLAFEAKKEAEKIISAAPQESAKEKDCPEAQKKEEEKLQKMEGQCACMIPLKASPQENSKTTKDSPPSYAIVIGELAPAKESSSFRGAEISYRGLNDQPFHGALYLFDIPTGEDRRGHTYGSELNFKAEYDWGDWGASYKTNLFVTPYSRVDSKGTEWFYYASHPEKDNRRYFYQNADEMTEFELSSHYYLKGKAPKNSTERYGSTYLGFAVGIEQHKDQKNSALGAITHRDAWHQQGNAWGLEYVDHMKDRTDFTTEVSIGREDYFPVGSVAFCTNIEAGFQNSTSNRVALDSKAEVEFNTAKLGGGTKESPLFAARVWTNIWEPFNSPETEFNPNTRYGAPEKNRGPIKDERMVEYGVGLETGGKNLRLSVEAIYENNAWSDEDLTYAFKVKYKF